MCGTGYHHRRTLHEHMKKHKGQTRCPVCQMEFSVMFAMRRHMVQRHGMTKDEVDRITNKRPIWPYHVSQGHRVQVYAEASGLLDGEATAAFAAPPPSDGSEL